jgi:hypothetical protein
MGKLYTFHIIKGRRIYYIKPSSSSSRSVEMFVKNHLYTTKTLIYVQIPGSLDYKKVILADFDMLITCGSFVDKSAFINKIYLID